MIRIEPTKEATDLALIEWDGLKDAPARDRRFSTNAFYGCLAETMFHKWSGLKKGSGIEWDFYIESVNESGNVIKSRIEFKSSVRNIDPRSSDTAKIPRTYLEYSESMNVTHLVFASLNKNDLGLTICGLLPIKLFRKKAKYYGKGEIPPNDTKPRNCDTYQIEYSRLIKYHYDYWEEI